MNDYKEIQIGGIAKEIILREMRKLNNKDELLPVDVAVLEKLTKLYCALMDDMRKNIDSNLLEKLQKMQTGLKQAK
jgi:hypothetical protein